MRLAAIAAAGVLALVLGSLQVGSAPTTHRVTTENFFFSPNPVTIKAGDKIVFENNSGTAHTATADGNPRAFDTGNLNPGQSKEVGPLNQAGEIAYRCIYHDLVGMTGTVVVQAATSSSPTASPSPRKSPSPKPSPTAAASPGPSPTSPFPSADSVEPEASPTSSPGGLPSAAAVPNDDEAGRSGRPAAVAVAAMLLAAAAHGGRWWLGRSASR